MTKPYSKLVKKCLKDTKAVSPIIATLLMIVIAVVAGVMVYGWVSGFVTTGVPEVPRSYVVTISSVTVDNVAYVDATNASTVLKVKMSNPGAKDASFTAANFIVTNSSGYTYDSTDTAVRVYDVSDTAITATANTTSIDATTNSVTLRGGATQTLYVELIGGEAGADTGALDNGDTYVFNSQDATTYDGDAVTSAQKTFKATK